MDSISFPMRNHIVLSLFALTATMTYATAAHTDEPASAIESVGCVGMTVSDLDRSIDFYSRVLFFQKSAEFELFGSPYETLESVFGLRIRVARMNLGQECIELTEYLTPK